MQPRNEDIPISAEQLNGPLAGVNKSKQILKIRSLQPQRQPSQQTEPLSNWHVPIISADSLSQHSNHSQQNSTLFNLLTQNTTTLSQSQQQQQQQVLSVEDNNIIEEFLNYELSTHANPTAEIETQDSKMLSIPTTLSLGTIWIHQTKHFLTPILATKNTDNFI